MNWCHETTKMGVPARHASNARRAGHRATVPRYRGIGPETYLNGTSQGPTPEDAKRTAILFALAALRSVPQAGSQFRGRIRRFMKHPG